MVSEAYRFSLQSNENALNIVLGSALGAYIGVALSITPDDIQLPSFVFFLMFLYPFVGTLLSIQNWAREKMWKPFFIAGAPALGLLIVTYQFSKSLPINSGIYAAIAGLWIFSVYIDTAKNVFFEKYFARQKSNE